MQTQQIDLKSLVRDIPDFPKKGIMFRDVSPILQNPEALIQTIDEMAEAWQGESFDGETVEKKVDAIAGLDARGFIFGVALAMKLGVPFIMVRKKGKLPGKVQSVSYGLEYGQDTIEISAELPSNYKKILIVDDLLATGGTAAAAASLVEKIGCTVAGFAFVIELSDLNGRQKLGDHEIISLMKF